MARRAACCTDTGSLYCADSSSVRVDEPRRDQQAVINKQAVTACRTAGEGLFVRALKHQLRRRNLAVPFLEHDLVAEMRGQPQTLRPTAAA